MTYDKAIRENDVTMTEFYATWCPHCQRMMPIVEQVKELIDGRAGIIRLDIDKNQEAANAEHVESVPTFIIYKNGKEVWRNTGELDGEVLLGKLESFA